MTDAPVLLKAIGWSAERIRLWVVLTVSTVVVAWWGRDPAARRYFWRA